MIDSVAIYSPKNCDYSHQLSQLLKLSTVQAIDPSFDYILIVDNNGLSIIKTNQARQNPIRVNFLSSKLSFRTRNISKRHEPLIKAVGKASYIIDTTAGMGTDAFILASAGYQVTLLEKNPIICALLRDGLHRAQNDTTLQTIAKRMNLIQTNSITYLKSLNDINAPDVIYIDPMFPKRTKAAKVKKEITLIQTLANDEKDNNVTLLETALQYARKRVIVKRPRVSTYLNDLSPTFSTDGKVTRFDVYIT